MSSIKYTVQKASKAAIPVAMIAVSFAAVLIRLSGSHPFTIAFYRMFFATLILSPFIYFNSEEIRTITRYEWGVLIFTGIFLAVHFASWISSLFYTSVVSSVVLVTSHPLVVTWVSGWYLGEKSDKKAYLAILLSIFGIAVMALSNYRVERWSLFGDLLAIVGMLAFAGYIIRGRQMRRTMSTATYSFVVYGIASLVLGVLMIFFGDGITIHPRREYLLFLSLAVVPTIFGHTLYNWALKFVRARMVSVSLLAEPVGATLLAFIILNEVPPYMTVVGAAITLAGVLICSRSD